MAAQHLFVEPSARPPHPNTLMDLTYGQRRAIRMRILLSEPRRHPSLKYSRSVLPFHRLLEDNTEADCGVPPATPANNRGRNGNDEERRVMFSPIDTVHVLDGSGDQYRTNSKHADGAHGNKTDTTSVVGLDTKTTQQQHHQQQQQYQFIDRISLPSATENSSKDRNNNMSLRPPMAPAARDQQQKRKLKQTFLAFAAREVHDRSRISHEGFGGESMSEQGLTSWTACAGGRIGAIRHDGGGQQQQRDEEKKSKKKKKKKKKKVDKKKKTAADSVLTGALPMPSDIPNSVSNEVQHTVGTVLPATLPVMQGRRRNRSKKRPRLSQNSGMTYPDAPTAYFEMKKEMFDGIDDCNLWNAAQSFEALDYFSTACQDAGNVAWTLIFADKHFSSPFNPSCEKYCTAKGPACTQWNCICDNQVRAMQARSPIFAAMFVMSSTDEDSQSTEEYFILPLGPALQDDELAEQLPDGFERMASWSLIPFLCGVPLKKRWDTFRTILCSKSIKCITFNSVVGLMPLHFHQSEDLNRQIDLVLTSIWDIKLAAWILRPDAKEIDLEFASFEAGFPHLCQSKTRVPQNASDNLVQLINIKDRLSYLLAMYPIISRSITKKGLVDSLEQIEGPLLSVLSAMECIGVGFIPHTYQNIEQRLDSRIEELSLEARNIAGNGSFLCSSPQQVAHLLYDVLKLPIPKDAMPKSTTMSSQHRSTSEAVLGAINSSTPHRIIDILLEFRSLNKLSTTYIKPLPFLARKPYVKEKNTTSKPIVRIHPMWMQTAVRTGRLSCRKPNMQQIPKDSTFEVAPRDAFCATSHDMCLFSFDYSQNEVRILAHMSEDQQLISLFLNKDGLDIYKQMSSLVTGKTVDSVTSDERSITKQVVLAILYGMGLTQVSKKLGINRSKAQNFFNSFFARFKQTKRWIEVTKESAKQLGFVTTIVGRRRYLDEIRSNDSSKRAQAERQAVNSVIQGSAADLMKLAMLKIGSRISDWHKEVPSAGGTGKHPRMLLQIHDELLFEVSNNKVDIQRLKGEVNRCCAEECELDLKLKVPLKVNCSVGTSWGDGMKDC